MNKLHAGIGNEGNKADRRADSGAGEHSRKFSKWALPLAASLAIGAHACGDMNVDVPVPKVPSTSQADAGRSGAQSTDGGTDSGGHAGIDSGGSAGIDTGVAGTDSAGKGGVDGGAGVNACVPVSPVCSTMTVSAVVTSGGAPLVVGDYRIAVELTYEKAGEQRAIVDLDDSCGNPVVNDQEIVEDSTVNMVAVRGRIEIDAKAEQVTIGAQSARITATMRCPGDTHDGGTGGTDSGGYAGDTSTETGGTDSSGGNGGTDSNGGSGGTDSSGGNVSDGGADTATGGTDTSTGGSDSGGGAGTDTGGFAGIDGGQAGDTATEGGSDTGGSGGTDSGGAVNDGGVVNDGGEAGTDSGGPACTEATADSYSGVITSGTPKPVGGYVIEYMGKSGFNTQFRISCGGSVIDEELTCMLGQVTTKVVEADHMSISIKPISAGETTVQAEINVAETQ